MGSQPVCLAKRIWEWEKTGLYHSGYPAMGTELPRLKKNDKKDVTTSAEWTHHANTSTDRPEKCPSSENIKQPVHMLQVLVIDQWML